MKMISTRWRMEEVSQTKPVRPSVPEAAGDEWKSINVVCEKANGSLATTLWPCYREHKCEK